jgi:colanic acid biosynthesis protein WcaH
VTEDDSDHPIPPDEYRVIARNVPIVSVDLLVHHDGGLVLGERRNEPAKGKWFVPGGTVMKGETLVQAVHRVARQELGTDVLVDRRLGTYEHFYDAAETPGVESKQYLATAFVVTPRSEELEPDDQHGSLEVFTEPFDGEIHDYVRRYIQELRALGYEY